MFIWRNIYSVNIQEIDQQHRQLIDLINELEGAMLMGQGPDVLEQIYAALVQYAQSHFATEERLMSEHGYPDFTSHAADHAHFVFKVSDLDQQRMAGNGGLSAPTLTFLCDWLSHHIMSTDRKYSAYLNARGVH